MGLHIKKAYSVSVVLLCLAVLLCSCSKSWSGKEDSKTLFKRLSLGKSGESDIVDFAEIFEFDWDAVEIIQMSRTTVEFDFIFYKCGKKVRTIVIAGYDVYIESGKFLRDGCKFRMKHEEGEDYFAFYSQQSTDASPLLLA